MLLGENPNVVADIGSTEQLLERLKTEFPVYADTIGMFLGSKDVCAYRLPRGTVSATVLASMDVDPLHGSGRAAVAAVVLRKGVAWQMDGDTAFCDALQRRMMAPDGLKRIATSAAVAVFHHFCYQVETDTFWFLAPRGLAEGYSDSKYEFFVVKEHAPGFFGRVSRVARVASELEKGQPEAVELAWLRRSPPRVARVASELEKRKPEAGGNGLREGNATAAGEAVGMVCEKETSGLLESAVEIVGAAAG